MKFEEVKPFLMAGFKVDYLPLLGCFFQKERDYIKHVYKSGDVFNYAIDGFLKTHASNVEWVVLDADPNKLTKEQAIQLMDAGYKIFPTHWHTSEKNWRDKTGYYFKRDDQIYYKHFSDSGMSLSDISHYTEFKLFDNEPIPKKTANFRGFNVGNVPPNLHSAFAVCFDKTTITAKDTSPNVNDILKEPKMFDFSQALKHMKEGGKVTCDQHYSRVYFFIKNNKFYSCREGRQAEACEFDSGDIIDGRWSIYVPRKDVEDLSLSVHESWGGYIKSLYHGDDVLLSFENCGVARVRQDNIEKMGFKLMVVGC